MVNRNTPLSKQQRLLLAESMMGACNGKAAFLAQTNFAGTIEVSNWIIFHSSDPDFDPFASGLSFAFQEAPIGLRSNRSLHLFKSLVAYLRFLFGEISKYSATDSVKAAKRAVPLLRLFGEAELLDQVIAMGRKHGAFVSAAALAREEACARYLNLNIPPMLLKGLSEDSRKLAREALGLRRGQSLPFRTTELLTARIASFNESAAQIWPEILALADLPPADRITHE